MIKWRELSIVQKFIILFILQNTSLILFSFFTEDDHVGVLSPIIIAFSSYLIRKVPTYKYFFIYSICISLCWLFAQNTSLIRNFHIDYNELKEYSGKVTYLHCAGRGCRGFHFFSLRKDENISKGFICLPFGFDGCRKETKEGNNISVKYVELYVISTVGGIIPIWGRENVIYEINDDDDKITYSYDYFIKKYSQQQKNVRIFATYIVIHSFVFCILYYMIHKNFIKRS